MVSLGEVQATARKAAAGRGLPWGLAEDAGDAVRWLCRHGLPGVEAVTRALGATGLGRPRYDLAGEHWRVAPAAGSAATCPLIAGPSIADCWIAAPDGPPERLTVERVVSPLLLLHALARIDAAGAAAELEWSGGGARCRVVRGHPALRVAVDPLAQSTVALSRLAGSERAWCVDPAVATRWQQVPQQGAEVDPAAWERLERYAAACLVPASDRSRDRGAGANLDDND